MSTSQTTGSREGYVMVNGKREDTSFHYDAMGLKQNEPKALENLATSLPLLEEAQAEYWRKKGFYEVAKSAFTLLIKTYPDHARVPYWQGVLKTLM
jgi:hypothetical protein